MDAYKTAVKIFAIIAVLSIIPIFIINNRNETKNREKANQSVRERNSPEPQSKPHIRLLETDGRMTGSKSSLVYGVKEEHRFSNGKYIVGLFIYVKNCTNSPKSINFNSLYIFDENKTIFSPELQYAYRGREQKLFIGITRLNPGESAFAHLVFPGTKQEEHKYLMLNPGLDGYAFDIQ